MKGEIRKNMYLFFIDIFLHIFMIDASWQNV